VRGEKERRDQPGQKSPYKDFGEDGIHLEVIGILARFRSTVKENRQNP
jgi:hypothetical protein